MVHQNNRLLFFYSTVVRFIRQVRDKLSNQEKAFRRELQKVSSAREGFQQVRNKKAKYNRNPNSGVEHRLPLVQWTIFTLVEELTKRLVHIGLKRYYTFPCLVRVLMKSPLGIERYGELLWQSISAPPPLLASPFYDACEFTFVSTISRHSEQC